MGQFGWHQLGVLRLIHQSMVPGVSKKPLNKVPKINMKFNASPKLKTCPSLPVIPAEVNGFLPRSLGAPNYLRKQASFTSSRIPLEVKPDHLNKN